MEPILEANDPEWYEERDFINSEFVEIKSDETFEVEMKYPLLGMENAVNHCLVRREVYERLLLAAKKLPMGYKLKIFDAWRPFALQKELYEKYSKQIIKDFELENCTNEQIQAVVRRFVSDPIGNRQVPPVHTTGGAVDLTIVDENGKELDMGSGFDEFSDRTYTVFYESEKNQEVKNNRRMLYHSMIEAGFTNLPSEWWHFDYGDRFWGYYTNKPAIYEGVFKR